MGCGWWNEGGGCTFPEDKPLGCSIKYDDKDDYLLVTPRGYWRETQPDYIGYCTAAVPCLCRCVEAPGRRLDTADVPALLPTSGFRGRALYAAPSAAYPTADVGVMPKGERDSAWWNFLTLLLGWLVLLVVYPLSYVPSSDLSDNGESRTLGVNTCWMELAFGYLTLGGVLSVFRFLTTTSSCALAATAFAPDRSVFSNNVVDGCMAAGYAEDCKMWNTTFFNMAVASLFFVGMIAVHIVGLNVPVLRDYLRR